jgi:choloylglycine hydrolase
MIDLEFLGFAGDRSKNLVGLPLNALKGLLDAPTIPFDGMNERGLAVGMAAVSPGGMLPDPGKATIDELAVMREILDHAGTVDEAIDILGLYNIDMSYIPIHYLIASADGTSALVEFYQGKMAVQRNETPWQFATNFIVASTNGRPQGQCPRYDRISQMMEKSEGKLSSLDALSLLKNVSQSGSSDSSTQWSIVYNLISGEINVVMGRQYDQGTHTLSLELTQP